MGWIIKLRLRLRRSSSSAQRHQECGNTRSVRLLENFLQDLRYGLRTLRNSPGFTVVAVITLALGIGATTAIFSLVNGVLLLPLPYAQPERLVTVYETSRDLGNMTVAYLNFRDWQRNNHSFVSMAAYRGEDFNLTGAGTPEYLHAEQVSAEFFPVLGVTPLLGRTFDAQEDRAGGAPVVVLTYGFWKQHLGGDPAVLSRRLTLNGEQYAVIGVLRSDFFFRHQAQVYLPLGQADPTLLTDRKNHPGIRVVARLKPQVMAPEANVDVRGIAGQLAQAYPDSNGGLGAAVLPMKDDMVGNSRRTLYLLLGAVTLVLLIACANVANLLLARSAGRKREFAVRVALGAGRGRLVRQLLTESILLAFVAGAVALMLAAWGTRAALAVAPATLPRAQEIGLDHNVLLFALAASILTGILFGLAPALSIRTNLDEGLREAGRTGSTRHRTQGAFVACEFALAMVLLIGAGLLIRSLSRLWRVDPGFDPHNVLTMEVALSPKALDSAPKTRLAFEQLLQRVRALNGVHAAALTSLVPLSDDDSEIPYWLGTAASVPNDRKMLAEFYITSPGYLDALKIPLRRGRFFNEQDTTASPPVIVVDDVFARERFPGEDPVGKRITIEVVGTAEIVGVVGHVKHFGLDTDATMQAAREEIYFPSAQIPDRFMQGAATGISLVVRSQASPLGMIPAIRAQVMGAERDQPVFNVATMEQIIAGSLARRRFAMFLLGAFAAIALGLAAIGIYGVISYAVTQRTHEIGIRMALGARRGDVARMVLGQGMLLSLAGVAVGLLAAFGATRLLASLLYGVRPADLLTFSCVALVLAAVALVASYLPARRATKVDPMVALRYE